MNLSQERTLKVRFCRNHQHDSSQGDIHYSGFSFTWPNGQPIRTGLNKFCQRGVQLFFGKDGLQENDRLVKLICLPITENAPRTIAPLGARCRRFYLMRQGPLGIIYFRGGVVTDVVFDETLEEPEVLEWIGLTPDLQEGEKAWIDILVIPVTSWTDWLRHIVIRNLSWPQWFRQQSRVS